MRLKPPVSEDAALEWLKAQVSQAWGIEITKEVERSLRQTARAMARVSAVDLPEEIEPLLV